MNMRNSKIHIDIRKSVVRNFVEFLCPTYEDENVQGRKYRKFHKYFPEHGVL
jgi:hypothetical protein